MHAGTGEAIMSSVQNGHDALEGDDEAGGQADRLVYREAPRVFGWLSRFSYRSRVAFVTLYGAGYATFVVLVGRFFSWSVVITSALIALFARWLDRRLSTVVTAETIIVQGVFHTWTLPISQVEELVARNLTGDPVYVVTQRGPRRKLHKVKPGNLTEISDLTGLRTQDWTQPH